MSISQARLEFFWLRLEMIVKLFFCILSFCVNASCVALAVSEFCSGYYILEFEPEALTPLTEGTSVEQSCVIVLQPREASRCAATANAC